MTIAWLLIMCLICLILPIPLMVIGGMATDGIGAYGPIMRYAIFAIIICIMIAPWYIMRFLYRFIWIMERNEEYYQVVFAALYGITAIIIFLIMRH